MQSVGGRGDEGVYIGVRVENCDELRLRLGLRSSVGEPRRDRRRSGMGAKESVSPRRTPSSVKARGADGRAG